MFDYRRLIPGRAFRLFILKCLRPIPDRWMLSLQYWLQLGRRPNLKSPSRFTEKIQLYKMNYRNPVMGECVDKYEVRGFVERKGLGSILNNIYGVYDDADEIDFDSLPEKFVIKTTDGGGGNNVVICTDKSTLDIPQLRRKLNGWLNVKDINPGREWAYTLIHKSRIIIEHYIEKSNSEEGRSGIEDFKILCFGGEPRYVIVDVDRYVHHRRNIYDVEWNNLHVGTDCPQFDEDYPRPSNLAEMLAVARRLSEDVPFVRVDLYNVDGKIFFGEMTFYPWSGYVAFNPDSFDEELGALMNI